MTTKALIKKLQNVLDYYDDDRSKEPISNELNDVMEDLRECLEKYERVRAWVQDVK